MTDHTTDRILYALFCLSRDTCAIDATALARAVGVSATEAAEALVKLERAGLVDATRARLTMTGLARAAALGAGGASGEPRVDLQHARPRARSVAPPLAAKPEQAEPRMRARRQVHTQAEPTASILPLSPPRGEPLR